MDCVVIKDLPIFFVPELRIDALVEQGLPDAEAVHASRVLRLGIGEEIYVTDGKGHLALAKLAEVSKRITLFSVLSAESWYKNWEGRFTLAIAPTKAMERMEWLLEKSVEIGVDRIILLCTKHSERKHINSERLVRIMLSAMKQSQKALLPELVVEVSLDDALLMTEQDLRLIAHCRDESESLIRRQTIDQFYKKGKDTTIFIGPEGDFTIEEVLRAQGRGILPITLGDSRLRTETAALVSLQWLHTLQLMKARE